VTNNHSFGQYAIFNKLYLDQTKVCVFITHFPHTFNESFRSVLNNSDSPQEGVCVSVGELFVSCVMYEDQGSVIACKQCLQCRCRREKI